MRFPFFKPYRAFPELDRFSDAECEGFVRLAKARHRVKNVIVALGGLLTALAVMVVGTIFSLLIGYSIVESDGRDARVVAVVVLTICGTGSIFGGVVLGNLFYESWLRSAIALLRSERRCAACSYSLLDLPAIDGGITCPECGQRFDLAARGLTAADVLAKSPAPTE